MPRRNRASTPVDIANSALEQLGRTDLEAYTSNLPAMENFFPVTGQAERRAGIWNNMRDWINGTPVELTSSTTVRADREPAGLTLESLRRARELLDRAEPPPYGRSPASDALDAMRYVNEATRNRNNQLVDISFERRHDINRIEVRTRLRELNHASLLEPEQLIPDNFPHIARETAAEVARLLEVQIMEQLVRASERMNREVYGQNGISAFARGMARHMDDVVLRHLMDTGTETKGPFAHLAEFKHKLIESNGWKAEVIDTHEKLTAEGEEMKHCIAGSYRGRMARGEYVAFHITPPAERIEPKTKKEKMPRTGFTIGFHKRGETLAYDQIKGKKNDTTYCSDSDLLSFVRLVDQTVNNGTASTPAREKTIRPVGVRMTNDMVVRIDAV